MALRVGGGAKQLQSACPPSRSSTGFVREWNGIEFIDRLPAAFFGRLEALLVRPDDAPRPTPGKPATPVLRVVGGADIETRVVAYLAACDPAISGAHGHDQAFGVACRVGPGFDLHPEDAYRYLRDHYNPRCQPPWSEKEMRHKVDDAYAKETRRGWLKDAERTPRAHRPAANPGERLASASRAERLAALGVTEAHTVTPTNVRWLWPGKVSARHMTLVGGPGGVGKSQSQAAIVASFTAGVPLPDGTMPLATGTVIILSAEDDAEDTVTPRLIAAGADLAKVKFVSAMETITAKDGTKTIHPRSFQDHDYWNRLLAEFPDAILIVADTLPTYLGRGVNDHKNIDVKNALEPFIAAVLKPHDLALVGVVHTGKAQDYRRAVDMILGSVAYGNTARCVWIVLEDPEQPGRFLFAWAKSNNYPPQDAIAYAIVAKEIEHDGGEVLRTSALEWEKKPVKLSANEIVDATRAAGREKRGPQRTTRRVAWDFIVGQLQAENDQPGVEIVKAWLDAGHKETPFWDARRDLIAAGALVVDDSRSPKIWHISDNIPEYPE